MNNLSLKGTYTALVTPFEDGHIHWPSLEKLLEHQLNAGVDGLVVLGTTAETSTLTEHEQSEVLNFVIKFVNKKVPVIAGATSNSTPKAVALACQAEALGADALSCAPPYYNKPTQEGLFQHFLATAEATQLPIVLYCNAARCVVSIEANTIHRLIEASPRFIGLKDCGGNCTRIGMLSEKLGSSFSILSGDDPMTLPYMAVGAEGVVSVISNLLPKEISSMVNLALANDFATARKDYQLLVSLFDALFCESNPIPIKYALYHEGIISSPEMRLPLVELSSNNQEKLKAALERFKQCV